MAAGLRADRHNLYGWQWTPCLHLTFDAARNTVLRAAAGRGFRVADPLADNAALLASAREFSVSRTLRPERAWNAGGSATQYFAGGAAGHVRSRLLTHRVRQPSGGRPVHRGPLLHHRQLGRRGPVVRPDPAGELQLEPLKGQQVKGAYKYLDVRTAYDGVLLPKPLTPAHRAFLNLGYASAFNKWRAEARVQWFGARPLAHVSSTHAHGLGQEYASETAPRYAVLNAQLTRAFKRLEVCAGAENLINYRQPNPVDGANAPFGPAFDAAMVGGPGRSTAGSPTRGCATASNRNERVNLFLSSLVEAMFPVSLSPRHELPLTLLSQAPAARVQTTPTAPATAGGLATAQFTTSAVCKGRLEKSLAYEKGVQRAVFGVPSKVLTVTYRPDQTFPDALRTAVQQTGYDADDLGAGPRACNQLPDCRKKISTVHSAPR